MSQVDLEIIQARDLPIVQRIGTQDPYVEVKCGKSSPMTKSHDNGGANPCIFVFCVPYYPGFD